MGTLIIVRRTLTVPKTALAGVTLETSFARFMTSMAASDEERTPFRSFGRWDLVLMAESWGSWEKVVWRPGSAEGSEA